MTDELILGFPGVNLVILMVGYALMVFGIAYHVVKKVAAKENGNNG